MRGYPGLSKPTEKKHKGMNIPFGAVSTAEWPWCVEGSGDGKAGCMEREQQRMGLEADWVSISRPGRGLGLSPGVLESHDRLGSRGGTGTAECCMLASLVWQSCGEWIGGRRPDAM